jgi:single-strand DNA-binding protein
MVRLRCAQKPHFARAANVCGKHYRLIGTFHMLRVTLVGNLGSDAEQRYTQKSTPIAQFRVAVNQVRTTADGEREESTEWFRISVAGRQAEYAGRLLKGQRVVVAGRLQITHFQRRDGIQATGFEVWADEVVNVSGRAAGDPEDGDAAGAVVNRGAPSDVDDDDSLPF